MDTNTVNNKKDIAIAETLESLVDKSHQTLAQILDDPTVSTAEKADIALRILQIAKSNSQFASTANPIVEQEIVSTDSSTVESKLKNKTEELQVSLPLTLGRNFQSNNSLFNNLKKVEKNLVKEKPNKGFQKQVLDNKPDIQLFSAEYFQLDNFLNSEEYQQVLNTALVKQDEFVSSKTVTNAANYRQSFILYATLFPDLYYLVKQKILDTLPSVLQQLNHPQFDVSRVEMQMTAHGDACFYKVHTDAGSKKTETRELTYVYYFYQEPKQFSGGELKIYDTEMKNNSFKQKEREQIVEPRNNSIVFFNSRCKHEVLQIDCDSHDFQHSRFTLNGWLRR